MRIWIVKADYYNSNFAQSYIMYIASSLEKAEIWMKSNKHMNIFGPGDKNGKTIYYVDAGYLEGYPVDEEIFVQLNWKEKL
jgi:hypothetical protein